MEISESIKKKKQTPYQKYMKINVPKLKSLNPNLTHKEIFRSCALSWKDAVENPKNQK
jgi:hypothetical protein